MKASLVPLAAAICALCGLLTGCDEVQTAQDVLTVTPSSVTVNKGQSVEFVAAGGFDYQWSLPSDQAEWGTLSTRIGDRTTYTSYHEPTTGAVDVLALTVTTLLSTGGGTNNQTYARTGTAYINHVAVGVTPTSVTLNEAGQSIVLKATGGSAYVWTVLYPKYGNVSPTTGPTTTYTATYLPTGGSNVVQTVTVSSYDSQATVEITQTK